MRLLPVWLLLTKDEMALVEGFITECDEALRVEFVAEGELAPDVRNSS